MHALRVDSAAFKRSSSLKVTSNCLLWENNTYKLERSNEAIQSPKIPYKFVFMLRALATSCGCKPQSLKSYRHLLHEVPFYLVFLFHYSQAWAFSWDDKKAGAQLLLAQLTKKKSYETAVQSSLDSWLPGRSVLYTPKGLAWREKWGANRYAANTAFLALVAADYGLKPSTYRAFAKKQIGYMLGDSGRSFVVGFGHNPPQRPHHRSSSCPSAPAICNWNNFRDPRPNTHVLKGALVGGPDQKDNYKDHRTDYVMNEVATDYNAGFQSAVAGLKQIQLGQSCA